MSDAWKRKPVRTLKARLHNRRVYVSLCRDGSVRMKFVRLGENPRAPITTELSLSDNAARVTSRMIAHLLREGGAS